VVTALAVARESGLPLAVRGGGHSFARHSLADGGLVLDLRLMDGVEIDPDSGVGHAQGGVLAGAYVTAAGEASLATGFGDTGTVGVTGLTLGGGIGFLSRLDGLTLDNLLGAEVVLADGTVVETSADEHPDLFWALRGGGGNFGVVTRLDLRLRELPVVTGGMLAWAAEPGTLTAVLTALAEAPDELSAMLNVMVAPPLPMLPPELHGRPLVMALACFAGSASEAEAVLARLRAPGAVVDGVREIRYPEMFGGGGPEAGGTAAARTGFLGEGVWAPDEAWPPRRLSRTGTRPGWSRCRAWSRGPTACRRSPSGSRRWPASSASSGGAM
jgi:FAD/FMN-containing dehydrogenase